MPAGVAPAGEPARRIDLARFALAFVVVDALLRFGAFVFRSEPVGFDPMLALLIALVAGYRLVR